MTTRTIKTALTVLGCVVLISAGTYVFRESLLRVGLNAFLAGDTVVTRLQGVQLSSTHARIDELELSLGPSGQQLTVADIDLNFSMPGLFGAPVMENLIIGSARLTNSAGVDDKPSVVVPAESVNGQLGSALLLSDLLLQLRDFPIAKMELNALEVPQFRQKLALNVAQQADALELRMASGTLQLLVTFTQANPDSTAQIMLSLDAGATTVAQAELSLQPQAAGYQLAGSGKVEFSDANTPFAEYLTIPLPLSSVALEWELSAVVPDALLSDPASSISLGILPGSTVVMRAGVVPDLGELAVVFTDRAELSFAPGAEMSIATGRIPLSLAGSWQEQALQSAVILTPSACHIGSARDCSVGFDGTASLAAYTVAGVDTAADTTISALEFSGSGSATIGNELVAVTVNPGSRLGSGTVTGPAFSIISLSAAIDSALGVSSSLVDQRLTITGEQISLTLAELKVGEYQVSSDFSLRGIRLVSAEKLAGKMQVQTAGPAVTGPQWIPAIGFDAEISVDGDMFAFSTPLLLPSAPADVQLQASGSYDLAAGTGEMHMELPALALTGTGNSLSSYLSGWPYPADVMTGTLALDLDVQLQPGSVDTEAVGPDVAREMTITGRTKIVLTDVAGFYAENFFKGLNTTIEAAYDSSALTLPVTTPPLLLTVDEVNVGMPITEISLNYQLDAGSQILNVSSIFGKLLDGTVSGMDINYDFSKERNDMTFMFSGLRLERMLELAEYEGIEATGAVSGELPVSITGGKVEVDAGKLYAEIPGGSIRYLNAPPAGQGNPAMDLVNQALSNYQFQTLESTIDYTPDGELLLAMQLRGHNPDMNGGQQINLNLNISDNIPTLLKSLQAGRAIEDFLQEQYK